MTTRIDKATTGSRYRIGFGHIEIGPQGRCYISEALDRNWVSEGAHVRRFEERFAHLFSYPFAVATSSGTDAGVVALAALLDRGASRGDEVITPALAFVSTANSILAAGLVPKFVDVELDTLNLDPSRIEQAITPRTRAIQAVHTMGKPCRMDEILAIARRHDLEVLEDCCEAHGASLFGRVVGSMGTAGFFSFYAAHLICSGEGGMIATGDPAFAELCRSVRSHGRRGGQLYFHFDRVGFNSKMNDLEAAIGLDSLENFDETFRIRRHHLNRLRELVAPLEDRVLFFRDGPREVISPHAFPVVLRDPDASVAPLYEFLEASGVQCKTLFGSLPTQHAAFGFMGHREGEFPVAERIGRTGLHFGLHQYLTGDDIEFVADRLRSFFSS